MTCRATTLTSRSRSQERRYPAKSTCLLAAQFCARACPHAATAERWAPAPAGWGGAVQAWQGVWEAEAAGSWRCQIEPPGRRWAAQALTHLGVDEAEVDKRLSQQAGGLQASMCARGSGRSKGWPTACVSSPIPPDLQKNRHVLFTASNPAGPPTHNPTSSSRFPCPCTVRQPLTVRSTSRAAALSPGSAGQRTAAAPAP